MNQVNCPICGKKCVKSGKTKAGSQRWFCKSCKTSSTHKINNESKEFAVLFKWVVWKRISSNDAWRRKNLSKKGQQSFGIYGLCRQR